MCTILHQCGKCAKLIPETEDYCAIHRGSLPESTNPETQRRVERAKQLLQMFTAKEESV